MNELEKYLVENEKIRLICLNAGCRILNLFLKEENKEKDVILGLENIADYSKDSAMMGAVVGRVANRIGNAEFVLNGKKYILNKNNGQNHLHGGNEGFDKKIFKATILEDGIKFFYESKDGEENYPGNLKFNVYYILNENKLTIKYTAKCDMDTIVNPTNHMYFNLSDEDTIDNHILKIKAAYIAAIDENVLTTKEKIRVKNTPFDFNDGKLVGEEINNDDVQLKRGSGYDHCFFLNEDEIILKDEKSKRAVKIKTSYPCAHIYTGNFLDEAPMGKKSRKYKKREGIAIETGFLSNSINIEKNSKTILKKDKVFETETSYSFFKI